MTDKEAAILVVVVTFLNIHGNRDRKAQAQGTHISRIVCAYVAKVVVISGIDSDGVRIMSVGRLWFEVACRLTDIVRNASAVIDTSNIIRPIFNARCVLTLCCALLQQFLIGAVGDSL